MEPNRTPPRRRRPRRRSSGALPLLLAALLLAAGLGGFLLGRKKNAPPAVPSSSSAASAAVPPGAESSPAASTAPSSVPPVESGDFAEGDWSLILVNAWTPLPAGHSITLTQLKNGQAVDERCYPALQKMMDDCRAAGLEPLICSSYRSMEKQERLFQQQMEPYLAQGYSEADARAAAGNAVAIPGTSEHQLGLALDIVDTSHQLLDESQEQTAVQQWLLQNSWKYGFILRYPTDKSDVTGIMYEPWHYRYVGPTAAKEIHEQGVCLEEYLAQ